MYELLSDISRRPAPFSHCTTKDLWTRPYLARQMLSYHLNQETDLASRRVETIDLVVHWIDSQLSLSGKKLCDLGCGPGLYTQRFAAKKAMVTGVDFSEYSLDYAKAQTGRLIDYIHADYLSGRLPTGFDVVTLIYCDFCALSPSQRQTLLGRMKSMLNPGGHIVLDVAGVVGLAEKEELTLIEDRYMGGFWAAGDYVAIHRSFVYTDERLVLDRYLIVEPDEKFQIFNWLQYFTPESIEAELRQAGFKVDQMVGGLTGEMLEPESDYIGIIASLA